MTNYLTGCSSGNWREAVPRLYGFGYATVGNTMDRLIVDNKVMEQKEYTACMFTSCRFTNVDFSGSVFRGCIFRDCHWTMCDLRTTTFIDCSFLSCTSRDSRTFQSDLFGLFAEAEQPEEGCFGSLDIDPDELMRCLAGHRFVPVV